jgi:CheY-like chemotaxis protein
VVDDNNINLKVAAAYLTKHNVRPDTADGGVLAIQKVQENDYDIVFMDHMMPDMDGIETTARIRALPGGKGESIPIIALSANAIAGAKELFLGAGMNDFLPKPIDPKALNCILFKWLPLKMAAADKADKNAVADESEYDGLLGELARIDGLDVAGGLLSVGSEKSVYINILRQTCSELGDYVNEIRGFMSAGNWSEYAIFMHAMKSAFANIGGERISKWAQELEFASMNADISRCVAETGPICDEMAAFHQALLETSLMREDDWEKTPLDAASIAQKLGKLMEACRYGMSDEAEKEASDLARAGFDETVEDDLRELRRLVKLYDYDRAIELAGRLTEDLSR